LAFLEIRGMKVEEGDSIPPWTLEDVSPERMRTVAAIYRDPNPVHWNRSVTQALGLGGRVVNQSPINLGYVMNMLMAWAGPTCIRRLRVAFPAPVLDGDRVTAGGRVRSLSRAGAATLAECDVWLDRQDGSRAVSGTAVVELPD
jgi:acyl dehydratase